MLLLRRFWFQVGTLFLLSFLLTFLYIQPAPPYGLVTEERVQESLDKSTSDSEPHPPEEPRVTFTLEHCGCNRTLPVRSTSSAPEKTGFNRTLSPEPVEYNRTTCGVDAWRRGGGQRTVAFSFYGDPTTPRHKAKQYFRQPVEKVIYSDMSEIFYERQEKCYCLFQNFLHLSLFCKDETYFYATFWA